MSSTNPDRTVSRWLNTVDRANPKARRAARLLGIGSGLILGPVVVFSAMFGTSEMEYAAILGIPLGSVWAVMLVSLAILVCFLLCLISGNRSTLALGVTTLLCVALTLGDLYVRSTSRSSGLIEDVDSIIGWSSFLPGLTGLFMGSWYATWQARKYAYIRQRLYLKSISKKAKQIAKSLTSDELTVESTPEGHHGKNLTALIELEELGDSLPKESSASKSDRKDATRRVAQRILSNRLVSDPFEPRNFTGIEIFRTALPAFVFAILLFALAFWQSSGALIGGPIPPVKTSHPLFMQIVAGALSFITCFLLTAIGAVNSFATGAAAIIVLLVPSIFQAFFAILTSRVVVPGDFWAISFGLASPLCAVWGGFALTLSLSSHWAWMQGTYKAAKEWLEKR